MKVAEAMTFDQYWEDPRFQYKKPNLSASKKLAFGDNIYHRVDGTWLQENSHHSFPDGTPNDRNIRNDTKADRMLIGTEFAYWGGSGPQIPPILRNYQGHDICIGRGYKKHYSAGMEVEFVAWLSSLETHGFLGRPLDWTSTP